MKQYESELFYEKVHGYTQLTEPHYTSECIHEIIKEVSPNYPQLTEYEKEWLNFSDSVYQAGQPVQLEYQVLENITEGSIYQAIPFHYKQAILKGVSSIVDEVGNVCDTVNQINTTTSVQNPILTTTGKNLYSDGDLTINNPNRNTWYYTNGKQAKFGSSCKRTDGGNWFYLEEGVYSYKSINENTLTNLSLLGEGEVQYKSGKEIPSGWYVFRFKTMTETVDYVKISQIQLEEGIKQTSYEPYKANILTVNEALTMRSSGEVYDELDLLTGRFIQRIDENNNVLAQEVVKMVELSTTFKPHEGTIHFETSSSTIAPLLTLSCPVVSTGQQTLNEINQ